MRYRAISAPVIPASKRQLDELEDTDTSDVDAKDENESTEVGNVSLV